LRALEAAFPLDLSGLRVMLDCANGATHRAAPAIFERLGAAVEVIGAEPDGRNINDGCGSTHLQMISERIAASDADLGFAFDGDGDRVLAVDGQGQIHDGDELIALCARALHERGELDGGIVVTVMTNYGFHQAMEEAGIDVVVTPVGDRYVLQELQRRGWRLGGEQSGHIIDMGYAPTGDGIAAALRALQALGRGSLAETPSMQKLPQKLVNVRVADRDALDSATTLWEAVEREERRLEGRGRVLVRPSGTEPLVRVMVEAPEEEEAESVADLLVQIAKEELGGG
jgi:phosphoglucosamine mutase